MPDALYYIHSDHLGSTSLVTDEEGNEVSRLHYSPYGSLIEQSGAESLPTDRLFTGQRFESIGLYDFRARFYDPLTANFLSPDSIVPQPGNPVDWNRYAYVRGNPLSYKDPTGHKRCEFAICEIFEEFVDEVLPDVYTTGYEFGGGTPIPSTAVAIGSHTVYDFQHNQKANAQAISAGVSFPGLYGSLVRSIGWYGGEDNSGEFHDNSKSIYNFEGPISETTLGWAQLVRAGPVPVPVMGAFTYGDSSFFTTSDTSAFQSIAANGGLSTPGLVFSSVLSDYQLTNTPVQFDTNAEMAVDIMANAIKDPYFYTPIGQVELTFVAFYALIR